MKYKKNNFLFIYKNTYILFYTGNHFLLIITNLEKICGFSLNFLIKLFKYVKE